MVVLSPYEIILAIGCCQELYNLLAVKGKNMRLRKFGKGLRAFYNSTPINVLMTLSNNNTRKPFYQLFPIFSFMSIKFLSIIYTKRDSLYRFSRKVSPIYVKYLSFVYWWWLVSRAVWLPEFYYFVLFFFLSIQLHFTSFLSLMQAKIEAKLIYCFFYKWFAKELCI